MKIVYDDYGGAHSTPLAAALHLGVVQPDRVPTNEELMALPLFDKTTKHDHGCLVLMGTDTTGHEVYALGRGPSKVTVERALVSGFVLAGGGTTTVRFFDTLPCVNVWMRIGGYLSRGLGWVALGRPLVLYGTRKAFARLCQFVTQVQEQVVSAPNTGKLTASDGSDLGAVAACSVKRGIVAGASDGPLVGAEPGQPGE